MLLGFGFEEASRACRQWFSEDFEEEADGLDERERIVN